MSRRSGLKIALVVPGGVDRSGEYRVIPVLLALIKRLTLLHEVHVFALSQEREPGIWSLAGARIHNVGEKHTRIRAVQSIVRESRTGRFDVIHSIWSGWCGLAAVVAARILRIPSIVHIAGGELAQLRQIGYGGRLSWKGRAREAIVLRAASIVTAASTPGIRALAALGIPARRLPLGIDLEVWRPRAPARRGYGARIRLAHVGSLNRVKDQGTLLRALAVLAMAGARFHLDVVGEDTLNGAVQALAQRLNIADRITFHGFLPQRELRLILEQTHALIMSSLHEAGPVAMLEAAVLGVPTVGTAVGHIEEWAPEAARAAPVRNHESLATAISTLIEDEDQRLAVARAAFARATAEDADFTAAQVQCLYETLTAPA